MTFRTFLLFALAVAPAVTAQSVERNATPNAVRLSKYILTVGNFERSWAFYHALGVEFDNATELRKPGPGTGVKALTNTPDGTTFRAQLFKIPGADFALEFTEFTNLERHAVNPRVQDPGAAMLTLEVRDIDKALAAAKKNGGTVISLGGAPLRHNAKDKTASILVKDPDGFFVELLQTDPLPASYAPADSNILGARFGVTVENADTAAQFYKDKFGFEVRTTPWIKDEAVNKFSATPGAEMRMSRIKVPATSLTWELFEYKGVDRKPYTMRVPDPGAAAFALIVRDVDAAGAAFKSAGGSIYSADGQIIRRPNGSGVAFMRDPAGSLIEVIQNPPANAVRMTKYILGVADLDRSVAFYRALGIELKGSSTGSPQPLPEFIANLVDVPAGTKFRNAMMNIPGAVDGFELELTEFSGIELHAGKPRFQDPGASVLRLEVRDLDVAVERVRKAGGAIATLGGKPLNRRGANGEDHVSLVVTDPDGYFLELMQSNPAPASSAPAGSLILTARFASVVDDVTKAAAFYRDALGFNAQIRAWSSEDIDRQLLGTGKGELRTAVLNVPGTNLSRFIFDFRNIDRKPYALRIPDPGAPAIGIQVRDLDAAARAIVAAGGSVITKGGSVSLPNGDKIAFVRDPSGVLVELAQPRPRE